MTSSADTLPDIRRLTVHYQCGHGRPPLTALDHLDLSLTAGETLSVVGESGSGKSALGNAVLGLISPTPGTIRFAGEDITHAGPHRRRELSQDIQAVFQDPHGSLNPVRTIGQTLEEPLLAHRALRRAERRAEVAKALERVRLDPDAATRYPHHSPAVCERPRHPYTQALLAAAPLPDPVQQRNRRLRHGRPAPADVEPRAVDHRNADPVPELKLRGG
jgi:ABC-type oligopeptide transport system ATPase subunit